MGRILYVEDEPWQVKNTVITIIERELKHTVVLVGSVAEAKEALSKTPYDVIFLDVMLDRTQGVIEMENSGLGIAKMILSGTFTSAGNPSSLPIIIASGCGILQFTMKQVIAGLSKISPRHWASRAEISSGNLSWSMKSRKY